MHIAHGFVWWGNEFKRKKEVKHICKPCGPYRGGWGIQISLGVFHMWIALLRGSRTQT